MNACVVASLYRLPSSVRLNATGHAKQSALRQILGDRASQSVAGDVKVAAAEWKKNSEALKLASLPCGRLGSGYLPLVVTSFWATALKLTAANMAATTTDSSLFMAFLPVGWCAGAA